MITLYTFGPRFGLPDPSPFVTKAEVLLKMARLEYVTSTISAKGLKNAPKGKLPYLDDNGTMVADSTFIRFHLEETYRVDFDRGLDGAQRATAWAIEKMCEDHLYWALVESRWVNEPNFRKGPLTFFQAAPAAVRPLVVVMVRRQIRGALKAHGMGRHARPEIERLAIRDVDAIAAVLGDKPWLMGPEPCGADASVWSFVAGTLCDLFASPIRDAAQRHANLVAYRDRGLQRWFPAPAATL